MTNAAVIDASVKIQGKGFWESLFPEALNFSELVSKMPSEETEVIEGEVINKTITNDVDSEVVDIVIQASKAMDLSIKQTEDTTIALMTLQEKLAKLSKANELLTQELEASKVNSK